SQIGESLVAGHDLVALAMGEIPSVPAVEDAQPGDEALRGPSRMEGCADALHDQRVAMRIEPHVGIPVREAAEPRRVEEMQHVRPGPCSVLDLRLEAVPQEEDEISRTHLL